MGKVTWKPGTMIYPLPAVLVSCGESPREYNLITVSWTGTVCTDPAMCYISLRPERHSYDIIKRTGEYVINLTTHDLAYATDWCGVKSGRDVNKFRELNLTPEKATMVNAPMVKESPVSIECRVIEIRPLGSHHMFLSQVLAVNADPAYIDKKTEAFHLEKARPVAYSHGKYYELGGLIGKFGWSVQKLKKGSVKKTSGRGKKSPLRK